MSEPSDAKNDATKEKPLTREDLRARYERGLVLLRGVSSCPRGEQERWLMEIGEYVEATK